MTEDTVSDEKQAARSKLWLSIVICVCIVALALVRILPWTVRVIPVAEDDSWDLVLNLMAAQHALCGKDYIFTFGPLGFMYNKTYFPATFDAKLMLQALFCSLTTVVMFLQGQRLFANKLWTLPWIFCIIALYGFFGDVLFLAVPVLLINQFFLLDTRNKMPSPESLLLVVLLALSAAVKFTFFIAAVWVMAFIAIDEFFINKTHRPILTGTFAALGLAAWLCTGQPIDTMVSYITSSLQVASGHSEAMSAVEVPLWYLGELTALAATVVILLGFSKLASQRLKAACIPAILAESGLFFLSFKAAYVRHTIDHEVIASSVFGFAALALLPIFLQMERRKVIKWVAGVATAILIFVAMPLSLPLDAPLLVRYPAMLAENVLRFCIRIGPCLSYLGGHSTYLSDYQKRMAEIREKNVLPKIEGSVDIYPTLSNVIIAYGFDYKPRPIFQSYLAYKPALAKINEEHLKSDKAADTLVIQELKDLYGYYPMLYDGPSWPEILARYEPKSREQGGLIVSKRTTPLAVNMRHLEDKSAVIGEVVPLNAGDGKFLFVKINVATTPVGALQKLFFRIYPPKIEVVLKDGKKREFIAPSEVMKSGFIISPFVQSPEQVEKLFPVNGTSGAVADEVSAFKITETKNDFPWTAFQKDYTLESYELEISGDTSKN